MSDKYMKEIEEILKQADAVLPGDRTRPPREKPKATGGPFGSLGRVSGGMRISATKLMLASFGLLLLALILGAAGVGNVVHVVVAGLVLFVIAYALFFVRPGASLTSSSYEKRWRGRPMEERQTMLDRFRRWLKS
jgi:hypothetical protein